jgi:glycosyl transferase family 87
MLRSKRGESSRSAHRWLVLGPAILLLAAGLVALFSYVGSVPVDSYAYLAAGERLNDGHELYAVGEGDRPVAVPPYQPIPLPYPPLIAVVWRPLASIPGELGLTIWWTASIAATIAAIVLLYERRPRLTVLAVAIMAVPLTVIMGVGNVDTFRLLMTIGAWLLVRRGMISAAAVLIGPLAVVKLTPAILGVWLVARYPRSIVPLAVATAVAALVSVLGAGIAEHIRYLEVAGGIFGDGQWNLSLAGLARLAGLGDEGARIMQYVGTAVLVVVVALLAGPRPGLSFAIAVAATAFAAPAGGWHTFAILLACLAPVAWPIVPPTGAEEKPLPTVPVQPSGVTNPV